MSEGQLPPNWQDVRFHTHDDHESADALLQEGGWQNTQIPLWPPFPEIPPFPDPENNPDPGGQPGDIFFDPVTNNIYFTDGDNVVQQMSLPDWFRLIAGAAPHIWQIDDLPTSDPGSNGVWLSAT